SAADQILDGDGPPLGHLEPNGRRHFAVQAHALGRRRIAMRPAVDIGLFLLLRRLALGVELLPGEVIGIGVARFQQLQCRFDVQVVALRLEIGSVRPADLWAFVPGDAEPAEAVEDWLKRLGLVALGIGVVDAEDELSALLPGEQPVEQRGAYAADVQIAGGTGGEAGAHGHKGGISPLPSTVPGTIKKPLYRPAQQWLPSRLPAPPPSSQSRRAAPPCPPGCGSPAAR